MTCNFRIPNILPKNSKVITPSTCHCMEKLSATRANDCVLGQRHTHIQRTGVRGCVWAHIWGECLILKPPDVTSMEMNPCHRPTLCWQSPQPLTGVLEQRSPGWILNMRRLPRSVFMGRALEWNCYYFLKINDGQQWSKLLINWSKVNIQFTQEVNGQRIWADSLKKRK